MSQKRLGNTALSLQFLGFSKVIRFILIRPFNLTNAISMCFKPVSLPDQLIDECRAFALSVFVLLAEDELVDVRDQLDGLADDEEDGDRDLKRIVQGRFYEALICSVYSCVTFSK